MYCRFCGNELQDNSLFCNKCGQKLDGNLAVKNNENMSTVLKNPVTAVEKREGLSVYLNDLCYLEFAISKLNDQISRYQEEVEEYYIKSLFFEKLYTLAENPFAYFPKFSFDTLSVHYTQNSRMNKVLMRYDGQNISFKDETDNYEEYSQITDDEMCILFGNALSRFMTAPTYKFLFGSNTDESAWPLLRKYETSKPKRKIEKKCAKDYYRQFTAIYDNFKNAMIDGYEKNMKEYAEKVKRLESKKESFNMAKSLLENEYALNIIPTQFRNLSAIYFIRDYFDSSRETLSTILFHLDLDKISQKLDTIMSNKENFITSFREKKASSSSGGLYSKLSKYDAGDEMPWASIGANSSEIESFVNCEDLLYPTYNPQNNVYDAYGLSGGYTVYDYDSTPHYYDANDNYHEIPKDAESFNWSDAG